jgi:DNA-binding NarL/FixJ family response regulator
VRGTTERSAVIVDRQPLWLEALEDLLEGVGIEVVGKATSYDAAATLVEEHRPDLLVAGIDASEAGIDCVRRACDAHSDVRAVVLSENDDPQHIDAAFSAGARVYCVKTAERDDLASAIRQAFQHSIYFASSGRPAVPAAAAPAATTAYEAAPELTRRELEILQLVAEGFSNSQLAKMLWVTEQTVKFHLSNIYRKLDVSNRTEASRWAQVHGLLPATTAARESAA